MTRPTIFWTPIGIESLREIVNFLSETWNDEIIDRFFLLIDEKIDLIQRNPEIGLKLENSQFRKIVIHKNTTLFYEIDQSIIKILLIWDNRQNQEDLRKKLESR